MYLKHSPGIGFYGLMKPRLSSLSWCQILHLEETRHCSSPASSVPMVKNSMFALFGWKKPLWFQTSFIYQWWKALSSSGPLKLQKALCLDAILSGGLQKISLNSCVVYFALTYTVSCGDLYRQRRDLQLNLWKQDANELNFQSHNRGSKCLCKCDITHF